MEGVNSPILIMGRMVNDSCHTFWSLSHITAILLPHNYQGNDDRV